MHRQTEYARRALDMVKDARAKSVTDHRTVFDLDDIVGPGVEEIAKYTPDTVRRVRWLILRHGFPHFKRGGRFYSRISWIRTYYEGGPPSAEQAA